MISNLCMSNAENSAYTCINSTEMEIIESRHGVWEENEIEKKIFYFIAVGLHWNVNSVLIQINMATEQYE